VIDERSPPDRSGRAAERPEGLSVTHSGKSRPTGMHWPSTAAAREVVIIKFRAVAISIGGMTIAVVRARTLAKLRLQRIPTNRATNIWPCENSFGHSVSRHAHDDDAGAFFLNSSTIRRYPRASFDAGKMFHHLTACEVFPTFSSRRLHGVRAHI
jgi:hypothetical protein